MSVLNPVSRFVPVVATTVNSSIGIFVRPNEALRLISVGYSFYDSANLYNAAADQFIARLCIIQGVFADDVLNFSIGYNMQGYYVLGNFFLNDPGPAIVPLFDADDGVVSDPGAGISVLLSSATAQPSNTQFLSSLFVSSQAAINALHSVQDANNAANAAATAAAAGGAGPGETVPIAEGGGPIGTPGSGSGSSGGTAGGSGSSGGVPGGSGSAGGGSPGGGLGGAGNPKQGQRGL